MFSGGELERFFGALFVAVIAASAIAGALFAVGVVTLLWWAL